jgi:hypothetical protein
MSAQILRANSGDVRGAGAGTGGPNGAAAAAARGQGEGEPAAEAGVAGPCGPDPAPYVEAIRAYEKTGFDEVYLGQVDGNLDGAFDFFASQVLPRVREQQPV